jgi:predicted transposase YdaD
MATDASVPTDHWFYSLFQSTPDLIALLLQAAGAAGAAAPRLGPDSPGNQLYRFEAVELKAVNHRLDGVLWPQRGMAGTARQPVVKLELQMQRDTRFKHRLGAQTLRFLQLHPMVRHLRVVVVVPHRRLNLGPARLPRQLQLVIDEVIWISLEELGQQEELDPLLNLLTLPVLHEPELQLSSQKILERRPDLTETVFPILMQRHPHFTLEQMMVYVKIPTQELRHSRAAQELLAEGRLEGRQQGEALGEVKATLRLLNHRCGPLSPATTARIQALPLEQLEALGLALLDFTGADDLAAWLEVHAA